MKPQPTNNQLKWMRFYNKSKYHEFQKLYWIRSIKRSKRNGTFSFLGGWYPWEYLGKSYNIYMMDFIE